MNFKWHLYLSFSIFFLNHFSLTKQQDICPFDSIYQIGDSTSDTGNLIRLPLVGRLFPAARPPYGQTFPGKPTGRWSDGMLIIDYIAMRMGLPLLNPYRERNASFENGVNFAVAGATALDISFLATRGVIVPSVLTTLSGQINWFQQFISTINCTIPHECPNVLENALVILGDIGNNDIDYALLQGRTIQEIKDFVPYIPQAIANATREIIRLGAKNIIVPGAFPLGCLPVNLVLFPNDPRDDVGCLINVNRLTQYFNHLLKRALMKLRLEFPNTNIIYADYYGAYRYLLRNGPALGFNRATLLKACCGTGGQYNFNSLRLCGSPGVPVCPNPGSYVQWDGDHLTQEAHRCITDYLLPGILEQLRCSS